MITSFLIPLTCLLFSLGQSSPADLEAQLADSQGPAKIAILAQLTGAYLDSSADTAVTYGVSALDLLNDHPNPKQELGVLSDLAKAYMLQGDYQTALLMGDKAKRLSQKLEARGVEGDVLNTIGVIYWHLGDYHAAKAHYLNALEIRERLGNPDDITASLNNIANVHVRLGDYDLALDFYRKALAIREETDNKAGVAASLNNLGVVYKNLGNNQKALEFYQRSLAINEETNNRQGIALSLRTIGNVFLNQGDYDAAAAYLKRSRDILEELGNREGVAGAIQALGDVYLARTQYDQALAHYQEALEIRQTIGNKPGVAGSLKAVGMVYKITGQNQKALDYYLRSLELHEELGNRENISASLSDIALLYTRLNQYRRAYQYLARDQVLQRELARETAALQNKLKNENQEKQLALLKKENQIRGLESERRGREIELLQGRQRLEAMVAERKVANLNAALIGLLLVGALTFYVFKRRGDRKLLHQERTLNRTLEDKVLERTGELKARNSELEQKNRQILEAQRRLVMQEKMASLGALTTGIAHEMKNPLNFVNNFSGLSAELLEELTQALTKEALDEDDREDLQDLAQRLTQNLDVIHRHGSRANDIVVKMMELSGGSRSTHQPADLNNLVSQYSNIAVQSYLSQEGSVPIEVEMQMDPGLPRISVIPGDLGRVILRIVENAVESLHDKSAELGSAFRPVLRIQTLPNDDWVDLVFEDNGLGIEEENLSRIFQPFFTTKSKAGAHIGLGLAITYDIVVDGHGGDLRVDTRAGAFTKMIISLPKKPIMDGERSSGAKDGLELSRSRVPTTAGSTVTPGEDST